VVKRGRLENLLPEVKVSEQSEHQIWKETLISDLPIIVTATYEWGDGETHFSAHRFRISTYVFGHQLQNYTLQDEYITAKKYASFDQADKITVLQNEKSEILTRLRRQSKLTRDAAKQIQRGANEINIVDSDASSDPIRSWSTNFLREIR